LVQPLRRDARLSPPAAHFGYVVLTTVFYDIVPVIIVYISPPISVLIASLTDGLQTNCANDRSLHPRTPTDLPIPLDARVVRPAAAAVYRVLRVSCAKVQQTCICIFNVSYATTPLKPKVMCSIILIGRLNVIYKTVPSQKVMCSIILIGRLNVIYKTVPSQKVIGSITRADCLFSFS
jgi:hypothetical protein